MKKNKLNNPQTLVMCILRDPNLNNIFFDTFGDILSKDEREALLEWGYIKYVENSSSGYTLTSEGLERLGNHVYIERKIPQYVDIEGDDREFVSFPASFDKVCSSLSDSAANALMMSFLNNISISRLDKRTATRLADIIELQVWNEHDG